MKQPSLTFIPNKLYKVYCLYYFHVDFSFGILNLKMGLLRLNNTIGMSFIQKYLDIIYTIKVL